MPPETTPKVTPSSLSAIIEKLEELREKAKSGLDHDIVRYQIEVMKYEDHLLALSRWSIEAKEAIDKDGPWEDCEEFDEECLNCKYCKLLKNFPLPHAQ